MVKEEKTVNYSLDALISINEKGQMVIPREIRKKADIKTGDKLAIITFEKEENIVCICTHKGRRVQIKVTLIEMRTTFARICHES